MTRFLLQTPSRLHFGLLSWGLSENRQFGGVGLMVGSPGLQLNAELSDKWEAKGSLADRVLEFAERVSSKLGNLGILAKPIAFEVIQTPPDHIGLGVGTQLGLSVARLVCCLASYENPSIAELAEMSGRGLRSGIGLHGFAHGGLIVDGGRLGPGGIPPLISRLEFPQEWSVLVVIPRSEAGLHGTREVQAFADLPPSSEVLTDQLCRLVLLGLLPAVVERDLNRFGEALEEIQQRVGQGFATAQGGLFASLELEAIATLLRAEGLRGVGQSSWGPTLYGFSDLPFEDRHGLLQRINDRLDVPAEVFWTSASSGGSTLEVITD